MKNLKLFYKKQFNLFGATPKGVAWTDSNKSKNRYKTLLKIIQLERKKNFSILDVGCGYGELIKYLPKNKNFEYTGIDVVEEMIAYAKKTYKDKRLKFKLADILTISNNYDYIVCNGIFTLKNDLNNKKMRDFVFKCIKNFYKFSRVGFSFNVMSDVVDYKSSLLFYPKLYSIIKTLNNKKLSKIYIDNTSTEYETSFFFIK